MQRSNSTASIISIRLDQTLGAHVITFMGLISRITDKWRIRLAWELESSPSDGPTTYEKLNKTYK